MALGGGTFTTTDKMLPGAYINGGQWDCGNSHRTFLGECWRGFNTYP